MTISQESLVVLPRRIAIKIGAPDENGCWPWLAALSESGYGRVSGFAADGHHGMWQAHRVVYELLVGPIPDGLTLDHLCRVRRCVNPEHVEPVTNRENLVRGVGFVGERVRMTHCLRGHEYTHENTYRWRTHRRCRECDRMRHRRYALEGRR